MAGKRVNHMSYRVTVLMQARYNGCMQNRNFLSLMAMALLGVSLLGGCSSVSPDSGNGTGRADVLVIQSQPLPAAYINENYNTKVLVSGGIAPYAFRVGGGTLPKGLKLDSSGRLSGTPIKAGEYKFLIEVSDANLNNKMKEVTMNVANVAPLRLTPLLPKGQIRGATRIPVMVKSARKLRAARIVWDLPKTVRVSKVQATDPTSIMVWKKKGNMIIVDIGFKNTPRSDSKIAMITVVPSKLVSLNDQGFGFESRSGTGKLLGAKQAPSQKAKEEAAAEKAEEQKRGRARAGEEKKGKDSKDKAAKDKTGENKEAPTKKDTAKDNVAGDKAKSPDKAKDPASTTPPSPQDPPKNEEKQPTPPANEEGGKESAQPPSLDPSPPPINGGSDDNNNADGSDQAQGGEK